MLYWVSVLEIGLFAFGMLLFFTFPSDMAFIFMHTLHLIRGVVGLLINKKLPKSHDIVS